MKKIIITLIAATIANTSFAYSRLIVTFAPTEAQQKKIDTAKTNQDKNKYTQEERAAWMQKLSSARLNVLSAAAGEQLVDLGPFALGGRVVGIDRDLTSTEMEHVISGLRSVSGVADVEEDKKGTPFSINYTPNPEQWSLFDVNTEAKRVYPQGDKLYGSSFYNSTTKSFISNKGHGVVVAVLDTGYTPHPDFISHLIPFTENGIQKGYGYTFVSDCSNAGECPKNTPLAARKPISPKPDALDNITYPSPYWHGTTVIGVIIGQHINEEAILGGAPDALVVPVRVMGTEGYHDSDLINGMLWAAGIHPDIPNLNPAQVINMSLGGKGKCPADMQKAIDDILAKNISIVIAAGNSNNFGGPVDPVSYPANCKGVISVAATNAYNHLANYSNVGDVTIAAPAGDSTPLGFQEAIYALTYTTIYKPMKLKSIEYVDCPTCFKYDLELGTSISAPLVSAAVADLLSANPKLTPVEIIKILQDSATPFASAADKCHLKPKTDKCITNNAGILNVAKALELVKENKF